MSIALCKCGVDLTDHKHGYDWEDDAPEDLPEGEHFFDASGTRHRCEELVNLGMLDANGDILTFQWTCPRPSHHREHGVECGPLTGKKLWE